LSQTLTTLLKWSIFTGEPHNTKKKKNKQTCNNSCHLGKLIYKKSAPGKMS
jgi:hypothetical protein